jgi:2-oxoglutarate ferredoxin oxidoreductase subunit gamma
MISEEAIHFPKVTEPNLLLAMSQEAANKYSTDLSPDSILVTDSLFVSTLPAHTGKVYELPITHSAKEVLGKALFANIIALGALVKITNIVSEESLVKAVLNRVPKGTEEVNKKALQLGMDLVK